MTEAAERLKAQLEVLPREDREALAVFLMSSLESDEETESDPAFNAELARRVADIRSGRALGIPAEEVFAELRRKYP
jgi:putative addiction module component (TIGR02574 family)